MNRNSQTKYFREQLTSNKIKVPFILASLGIYKLTLNSLIDPVGSHSIVMAEEKELLHIESTKPFKIIDENHVLEVIGLTNFSHEDIINHIPKEI